MDWHTLVFELIDLRSFSNLWFWIALAVLWSTTSHWVMGVPYDLIQRAARRGGAAMDDLQDVTRVNVNRILYIVDMSGIWLLAFACFMLTVLAVLGFYYRIEFCQAVFLMLMPLSVVGAISVRTARRIHAGAMQGDALIRALRIHRVMVQGVAMVAIFVTGMWGMYQLLNIGVLHN